MSCVFFFTWESEEVEWFLCRQLIYSKDTESQSFWREEGWQVHVLREHEVRIQGPRDQIFAHTLTQLWEQGHRYSLNVSWNCTFFLPFPSSNYLNKQRNLYSFKWNPERSGLSFCHHPYIPHTHRHAHTYTHAHTHTHAQESPGVQMYSLFEEEWRRENQQRQKTDSRGSWEQKCLQSPSLSVTDQTTTRLYLFVCLFRNQKLITSRWVIAILCLFLILSKLKSITLDYVSFICQPSSYSWRKTVLNHCGFFGLPFMSLLHEAHGEELTRFLNAWNEPQSPSQSLDCFVLPDRTDFCILGSCLFNEHILCVNFSDLKLGLQS